MKIKYSALVSDMRGKLNGSVASKNRYGSYLRNKITPVNPQTASQVAQRTVLAKFAAKWRTLTNPQRLAWNSAVNSWTRTNIFGDVVTPSGNILYNRLNMSLTTIGQPEITIPPMPQGADPLDSISVTADETTQEIEVTVAPQTIPAGHTLVIEATEQTSPGVYNANNKFRIVAINPVLVAGVVDIHTDYTAKFGSITAGLKIFVRAVVYNNTTGEKSLPLKADTIIV